MDAQRRVPPNEVLIQIFELLHRTTIYQCIFVCKAWLFAAIQTYYKHFRLNGKRIHFLKEALNLDENNENPPNNDRSGTKW